MAGSDAWDAWTLPLVVDAAGRIGGRRPPSVRERLRLVLEVEPGERPLLPEFGCAVHRMPSIESEHERQIAAVLVEEALERWAPWARVRRADVVGGTPRRLALVLSTPAGKMELEIERVRASAGPQRAAVEGRA
jgi:hypothetical protein